MFPCGAICRQASEGSAGKRGRLPVPLRTARCCRRRKEARGERPAAVTWRCVCSRRRCRRARAGRLTRGRGPKAHCERYRRGRTPIGIQTAQATYPNPWQASNSGATHISSQRLRRAGASASAPHPALLVEPARLGVELGQGRHHQAVCAGWGAFVEDVPCDVFGGASLCMAAQLDGRPAPGSSGSGAAGAPVGLDAAAVRGRLVRVLHAAIVGVGG